MTLKIGESVRCSNPDLEWFKRPPQAMVVKSLRRNRDGEEVAVLQITWTTEINVLAEDFELTQRSFSRLEQLSGGESFQSPLFR